MRARRCRTWRSISLTASATARPPSATDGWVCGWFDFLNRQHEAFAPRAGAWFSQMEATAMATVMHERTDPANGVRIAPDVKLGKNVSIHCFVNLYGCSI